MPEVNRTLAEPLAEATPSAVLGAQELIRLIEEDIGGVMGIGRANPQTALADLARIKQATTSSLGDRLADQKSYRPSLTELLPVRQKTLPKRTPSARIWRPGAC